MEPVNRIAKYLGKDKQTPNQAQAPSTKPATAQPAQNAITKSDKSIPGSVKATLEKAGQFKPRLISPGTKENSLIFAATADDIMRSMSSVINTQMSQIPLMVEAVKGALTGNPDYDKPNVCIRLQQTYVLLYRISLYATAHFNFCKCKDLDTFTEISENLAEMFDQLSIFYKSVGLELPELLTISPGARSTTFTKDLESALQLGRIRAESGVLNWAEVIQEVTKQM